VKIAFLIRALTLGGAERQLVQLAVGLARRGHEVAVLTFYRGLADRELALREAGARQIVLQKRGRWDLLQFGRALREAVDSFAPDVLYSFLPTSNVIAASVLRRRSGMALVWGVRASNLRKDSYDWLGRTINRLEGWMQSCPDLVIANSRAGVNDCLARGFEQPKLRYVPNGLDPEGFGFEPGARRTLRTHWGLQGRVLGFAGRLDPMKGLEHLFAALSRARGSLAEATLVVACEGGGRYAESLHTLVAASNLTDRVRWIGPVADMKTFYSAIDVLCLPSIYGEGTSNVVAEALACGCPCVTTRVGDLESLVSTPELLAEPADADDLLRALNRAVNLLPQLSREVLREQILAKLPWQAAVEATEQLLQHAISLRRGSCAAAELLS